ncbi:MAG: hypothetical protein J5J06_13875 [Phycisphaerae bacterium]|nr:hypothetical protein [Phycisphaerae bacterium]
MIHLHGTLLGSPRKAVHSKRVWATRAFAYCGGIDGLCDIFADPDSDNRYEEFYFLADDGRQP